MNPIILLVAGLSFFVGMFGYVLIYFWLRPVIGYRKVKHRLIKDLNAITYPEEGQPQVPEQDLKTRKADASLLKYNKCWGKKGNSFKVTNVFTYSFAPLLLDLNKRWEKHDNTITPKQPALNAIL